MLFFCCSHCSAGLFNCGESHFLESKYYVNESLEIKPVSSTSLSYLPLFLTPGSYLSSCPDFPSQCTVNWKIKFTKSHLFNTSLDSVLLVNIYNSIIFWLPKVLIRKCIKPRATPVPWKKTAQKAYYNSVFFAMRCYTLQKHVGIQILFSIMSFKLFISYPMRALWHCPDGHVTYL